MNKFIFFILMVTTSSIFAQKKDIVRIEYYLEYKSDSNDNSSPIKQTLEYMVDKYSSYFNYLKEIPEDVLEKSYIH